MREIRLPRPLAAVTGHDVLELEVRSPAEAVRALCALWPECRRVFADGGWAVLVGDRSIDARELRIRSSSTAPIEFVPLPAGGGEGAGPLKFIFGALLAIISLGTAAPLIGVGGSLAGVAKGLGVAFAIGGLQQTLFPKPEVDDYQGQEAPEARSSFLFSTPTNAQQAGQAIPLVYGEISTGSIVVSSGSLVTDISESPDELRSSARLEFVDVLGEGELDGLVGGDQGIYLDGVPVENANGTRNFPGATFVERRGEVPSTSQPIAFSQREVGVAAQVTKSWTDPADPAAGSIERTISDPNVDRVRVVWRLPQLFEIVTGEADRHTVDFGLQVDAGGAGFKYPGRPIYRDERPLTAVTGGGAGFPFPIATTLSSFVRNLAFRMADPAGWYGFRGCTVIWRTDPGISSYDFAMDWSETGTGSWTLGPAVSIPIVFYPAGSATGFDVWALEPGFEYRLEGIPTFSPPAQVDIRLGTNTGAPLPDDWRLPAFEETTRVTIYGRALSPYEVETSIELDEFGAGPWVVRAVRFSDDETDPQTFASDTYWSRYSEVIDADLLMEGVASVAGSVTAEETAGRVPARRYIVRGQLVRIPSNYDPVARTYTGIWDGVWSTDRFWTDNPAFVLFDLLTRHMGLADDAVEKWGLYAAGEYSDELVEDGNGGLEPRFRFSHPFNTREDELKILAAVASSMQATLWYGGGQVIVTQDRPEPASRFFSRATVIDGRFEYLGVARSARHTIVHTSWRDPATLYEHAVDPWTDEAARRRFGDRELEVRAIGVTSAGQARRFGRLALEATRSEGAGIRFGFGLADVGTLPGDVIEVGDQQRERIALAGRVVDWDGPTSTIELDRDVELEAGGSYVLYMLGRTVLGMESAGVLTSGPFTGSTLLIAGGWSPEYEPGPHRPWLLVEATQTSRLYRVFAVRENEPGQYELQAALHDPDKYTRVEDFDYQAPIPPPPSLPAAPPAIVTGVAFDLGGSVQCTVFAPDGSEPGQFIECEAIGEATQSQMIQAAQRQHVFDFDGLSTATSDFRARTLDPTMRVGSSWLALPEF